MITLPYTHVVVAQNSYASRVENLNPVLNFTWTGICKLSPSGDEWFETERNFPLIINREGNFNTVLAQNRNAIGTVWNAWQTQWSGTSTSTRTFRDHSFTSAASRSVDLVVQLLQEQPQPLLLDNLEVVLIQELFLVLTESHKVIE